MSNKEIKHNYLHSCTLKLYNFESSWLLLTSFMVYKIFCEEYVSNHFVRKFPRISQYVYIHTGHKFSVDYIHNEIESILYCMVKFYAHFLSFLTLTRSPWLLKGCNEKWFKFIWLPLLWLPVEVLFCRLMLSFFTLALLVSLCPFSSVQIARVLIQLHLQNSPVYKTRDVI
mgnify:CR=1 FL=1